MKDPVFVKSDVTLLLAIAWGSREAPASLKDIIKFGDYVWRTILSGPEIRRGIAKLLAMGYIEDRGQCFVLTGDALQAWQADLAHTDKYWDQTGGHFPGHPSFERLLLKHDRSRKPHSVAEDDGVWRYEAFDDDLWRAAYEAHAEEVEAEWAEWVKLEDALDEQEKREAPRKEDDDA
jgi:hypothetical protein